MTAKKKAEFLDALADRGSVAHACERIKISRQTAYNWRHADEVFAKSWAEAVEKVYDQLEKSLYERAVHGVEEPVFYQGDECGRIRRYSDTAAIFLLKGGRPAKYRDRFEHSGPDGGPIAIGGLSVQVIESRAK